MTIDTNYRKLAQQHAINKFSSVIIETNNIVEIMSSSNSRESQHLRNEELQRVEALRNTMHRVSQGDLPSNQETVGVIASIQDSPALMQARSEMTPQGQKLVDDAVRVLEDLKLVINDKNEGDHLQQAIKHSKTAVELSNLKAVGSTQAGVDMHLYKSTFVELINAIVELGKLLVTSSEFRNAMSNLADILRDIVNVNTGLKLPPLKEGREHHQSIMEEGRHALYGEQPWTETAHHIIDKISHVTHQVVPEDKIKQMKIRTAETAQRRSSKSRDGTITGGTHDSNVYDNSKHIENVSSNLDSTPYPTMDANSHDNTHQSTIQTMNTSNNAGNVGNVGNASGGANKYDADIPPPTDQSYGDTPSGALHTISYDEYDSNIANIRNTNVRDKDAGRNEADMYEGTYEVQNATTRKYGDHTGSHNDDIHPSHTNTNDDQSKCKFKAAVHRVQKARSDVTITEEHKRQLTERIRSTVAVLASRQDYQQGVEHLIKLFGDLVQQSKDDIYRERHQLNTAVTSEAEQEARIAEQHIETVLVNFAGHRPLVPVKQSGKRLATAFSEDDELIDLWDEFKELVRELLYNPNDVSSDWIRDLVETIRTVFTDNYRDLWNDLFYSLREWFEGFGQDEMNMRLVGDVNTLISDAFFDAQGKPVLRPELIKDIGKIVPLIADQIAYLPIPRFEHEDDDYHMIFDNIIIKASGLLPKHVELTAGGVYDLDNGMSGSLHLRVSRIQASGRNISYFFRKKRGLIHITDSGLADFDIYGNQGLTFDVELVPYLENSVRGVRVAKCTSYIDKLNIKLHDSRHNFLVKVLKGAIEKIAKKQIDMVLCNVVNDIFTQTPTPVQNPLLGKSSPVNGKVEKIDVDTTVDSSLTRRTPTWQRH